MNLLDIVPVGLDYDYFIGYVTGQRVCQANAYLHGRLLTNVARIRYLEAGGKPARDYNRFVHGFRTGYHDELRGLAHPLPQTDVPYHWHETRSKRDGQ